MKPIKTPKVIADPIYGIIDVRPVLPMIETEEFQALGDKRQLGMSYLVFPSATHSRKAHSLGSYHATRELADRWIKDGFINVEEGRALAGYALYHDIGHPAFSHVTEPLCEMPTGMEKMMSMNGALSLSIMRRLKKQIEASGINFKLMEAMATHKNPLYLAVSDKNLGMEKLDYLERDGACTVLSRPAGVAYLRHHIYFIGHQLVIDEKVVDNAIEIQNFYMKMYKNVYLRKTSAIAQRMIQKIAHHLMLAGELSATQLPNLTDSELIGIMHTSKDPCVQKMYILLKRRELFREAIVVKPKKIAEFESQARKGSILLGATPEKMEKIAKDKNLSPENQAHLEKMEDNIAHLAGLPNDAVLVIPIYGQERFEAQDIAIYQGSGKKLASLKARYPAHFKNTEEVAQTYLAFRVCTTEPYRQALSSLKIAKKVFALIMNNIVTK